MWVAARLTYEIRSNFNLILKFIILKHVLNGSRDLVYYKKIAVKNSENLLDHSWDGVVQHSYRPRCATLHVKTLHHMCFRVNLVSFGKPTILQNTCEQIFLDKTSCLK